MAEVKKTSKKVAKTNTNCIVDTGRLITEFENIEFAQTYPSTKNVKIYRTSQKILMSDPKSIELMIFHSQMKDADDKLACELQLKIIDLEAELDEKYDRLEGINNLILSSFSGTKYKKGHFKIDNKIEVFEISDFEDLPEVVYIELANNAIKLITIQDDEEKN